MTMALWTPQGVESTPRYHSGISSEVQDKVHNGVPELGWHGDPNLWVLPLDKGVEVVQLRPGQPPIAATRWNGALNENFFLHLALMSPYGKKGNEVVERVQHDTERVRLAEETRQREALSEGAERVAYYAKRAL